MTRGRSSREPLNRIARKVAALCLARRVRLILRLVPTKRKLRRRTKPWRSRRARNSGCSADWFSNTVWIARAFDSTLGFPGEGPALAQKARSRRMRSKKVADDEEDSSISNALGTSTPSWKTFLLARAVQTSTAKMYLQEFHRFLSFAEEKKLPFQSWEERDSTLRDYLGYLYYDCRAGPERGAYLLGAFNVMCPRYSHHLPYSWRCMLAWKRPHVGGEGQAKDRRSRGEPSLFG